MELWWISVVRFIYIYIYIYIKCVCVCACARACVMMSVLTRSSCLCGDTRDEFTKYWVRILRRGECSVSGLGCLWSVQCLYLTFTWVMISFPLLFTYSFPFPHSPLNELRYFTSLYFSWKFSPKFTTRLNTGKSKASKSAKNALISVGFILTTCSVVLCGKYVMQLMHGQTLWLNDKHSCSLFGRSRAPLTNRLVVTEFPLCSS